MSGYPISTSAIQVYALTTEAMEDDRKFLRQNRKGLNAALIKDIVLIKDD